MIRKPGRPLHSPVRQNIIDLVGALGNAHGYELHKLYNVLFSPVTQRTIYYHLKKGVSLEELRIVTISTRQGSYSWGKTSEHVIYALGPRATLRQRPEIQERLKKQKL